MCNIGSQRQLRIRFAKRPTPVKMIIGGSVETGHYILVKKQPVTAQEIISNPAAHIPNLGQQEGFIHTRFYRGYSEPVKAKARAKRKPRKPAVEVSVDIKEFRKAVEGVKGAIAKLKAATHEAPFAPGESIEN